MPRKNTSSQKAAVVKVTTDTPPPPKKRRPGKSKPKLSTAAWIGYILAGVVVGTGLAVFAVRYRLLSPRIISGLVLVLGVGLAAWFLQPKKRDPRWALVGGGVAAIGASQFMFQTLARPRNGSSRSGRPNATCPARLRRRRWHSRTWTGTRTWISSSRTPSSIDCT